MKRGEKQQQHHHHHLWFNFHLHLPRIGNENAMPPKGHVPIWVGLEGEEPERFVVPLVHLTHPLFVDLLNEAEKEYGFDQKGSIVIPCNADYFRRVEGIIGQEFDSAGAHHHHHHHHHHLPHFALCFRA